MRDSQQQLEKIRDMQQLHVDSERQPVTIRDSERHVATPWDQKESERKQAAIGDSERHAATPWNC